MSASNAKTSPASASHSHASNDTLIDVDNVSVMLSAETAVEGVSFCIHRGEFIGLIGPNGAGKTTLLKALLGLLPPTKGTIARQPIAIGYIPQRGALYHGIVPMSVREVVSLGAASKGTVQEALAEVGVTALAAKRFTELSGGQQQRVAIAKALAGNSEMLILDEPTTGIDERSQEMFYALLTHLQQRGITIIMVSHEVDTVLKLVTRVMCLNRGMLYDGLPEHFETDKYLPAAYKARHRQLHHHHGQDHV